MIAIAFVSAWAFVWLFGDATHGVKRLVFQLFIWLVLGVYFVTSWLKQGQTLPMRSWKLQLITQSKQTTQNAPIQLITVRIAILRYILATLSLCLLGLGFFWRLFDRHQLFLHDRLLHTRIIQLAKHKPSQPRPR